MEHRLLNSVSLHGALNNLLSFFVVVAHLPHLLSPEVDHNSIFSTSSSSTICFSLVLNVMCFAQLSTSTAFRSSISGLNTKWLTSTLNAIIYYY
jgi:hypothetical protein